MKTVACIIARTNSTRLPKKVLKKINNKLMIEHIIERVKRAKNVDEIYMSTSTHPDDQRLKPIAHKNNINFYAGSEESVIDRMLDVSKIENADNVIRITGDNIFTDSVYLDLMIEKHNKSNADYTRTEFLPLGITAEVISVKALQNCYKTMNPDFSQYLGIYIFEPEKYKCTVLIPPKSHHRKNWSFTVDTKDDWERTKTVFKNCSGLIDYKNLLALGNNNKLPNLEYGTHGLVKFPAGLLLRFSTYRNEMEERIQKSNTIQINMSEYNGVLNEQSKI